MQTGTGQRVVIAGSGVAGAAVALGLRQAGFAPEVYEARPRADAGGAWLNLAPNGVAAMDALGLGARVRAAGHAARGLRFQGANGKVQFEADFSDAESTYGAPFLNLRRADLYAVLQQGLADAGIPVYFGQRLETFNQQANGTVRVQFDGRVVETPLLIGADGLRSRVRQTLFPDASAKYAGIVGLGGYSRPAGLRGDDWIVFTQGPDAFFGSVAEVDGGVWWFSNIPAASEPPRTEIAPETWPGWLERARVLHRNDVDPIPRILAAQTDPVSIVPEYEVPSLRGWSRGNVVLIGDAAHAMPPHSGQGAAMGLEDAVVLADALARASSPAAAFAEYERQRRPRVQTALRIAHQHGIRKQAGPMTGAVLDALMPVLARLGQRQLDTLLRYRVSPVTSAAA